MSEDTWVCPRCGTLVTAEPDDMGTAKAFHSAYCDRAK
jgi:hypothetical protein